MCYIDHLRLPMARIALSARFTTATYIQCSYVVGNSLFSSFPHGLPKIIAGIGNTVSAVHDTYRGLTTAQINFYFQPRHLLLIDNGSMDKPPPELFC
jgi:hypothetical protein